MRVIFVGIHNKPGMRPLDSKTRSGKKIDEVIAMLPKVDCVQIIKTNLFDVDYEPVGYDERNELIADFFNRIDFKEDDIAVLLGESVHRYIYNHSQLPPAKIKLGHPSLQWTNTKDKAKYVPNAVEQITKKLKSIICLPK